MRLGLRHICAKLCAIFATEKHAGAFRKGTNIPYIVHPLEAVAIVATITNDDEVLAGAALHDVVEDTDATIDDIRREFGERRVRLILFVL